MRTRNRQNKHTFNKSSYLSQVRQLRLLATEAISRFLIHPSRMEFIQHGENATFKVTTRENKRYLLRIHRGGYHKDEAILEELSWLTRVAKQTSLKVPKPVPSRLGRLLERVGTDSIPEGRACCLFEWIEGHHIRKHLRVEQMYHLGQLIAKLQAVQPVRKIKHRRYWLAEGLIGRNPKFGTIDRLKGVRKKAQETISRGRLHAFRKLREFERKFPKRTGLIHADLHFGNVLVAKGKLAAIDFDDCGLGFFAYDLAVAIMSMRNKFEKNQKEKIPIFRKALIDGYASIASWDQADEEILPHLLIARELMAVSWLNSRSDNPRLRKHLEPVARRVVRQIKKDYGY